MKAFVLYTAARLGLFAACWLVIIGAYQLVSSGNDVPILWPLLVAAVVSMLLSLVLLRGLRESAAAAVSERATRASASFEQMRAKEDEELDALERSEPTDRTEPS